jgi:hypothetical protein
VRGQDVTIDGQAFQTWTDAGGDYAVSRTVRVAGDDVESYLVVGTAPDATIREFASGLKGGTVPPPG